MNANENPKPLRWYAQTGSVAGMARVEALNQRARVLAASDPRKALEVCEQVRELAEAIGDQKGMARSMWITGLCLYRLSAFDLSLEHLARACSICDEIDDQAGLASCLNDLGRVHVALANPDRAVACYTDALRINRKLGRKARESTNLENIADLYANLGDYVNSLEFRLEHLKLERELGKLEEVAETLFRVGVAYLELYRHEEARAYLREALDAQRQLGDWQAEAITLLQLAQAHGRAKEDRRALELAQEAYHLSKEIGYRHGEVAAHRYAAEVFARTGEHSKALRIFDLALKTAQEVGDRRSEAEILLGTARSQLASTDAKAVVSIRANTVPALERALEIALLLNSRPLESRVHELLAQALERSGEALRALHHSKRLTELSKATHDEVIEHRLLGLAVRFDHDPTQPRSTPVWLPDLKAAQDLRRTSLDTAIETIPTETPTNENPFSDLNDPYQGPARRRSRRTPPPPASPPKAAPVQAPVAVPIAPPVQPTAVPRPMPRLTPGFAWKDQQDLLIAVALIVFGVILSVTLPGNDPATRIGLSCAPILLALSYGLTTTMFPRRNDLNRLERILFTIGVPVGALPLLALAVDDLQGIGWLTLGLGGIAALCLLWALWRRSDVSPHDRYVLRLIAE